MIRGGRAAFEQFSRASNAARDESLGGGLSQVPLHSPISAPARPGASACSGRRARRHAPGRVQVRVLWPHYREYGQTALHIACGQPVGVRAMNRVQLPVCQCSCRPCRRGTHDSTIRHRLRAQSLVVMTLVVMICLGIDQAPSVAAPHRRVVVPWLATEVKTPRLTIRTPPPAPAPPCTGAALSARPGPGGAAAGNEESSVVFTNVSSASCRVEGYPDVVGIRSNGTEVPLVAQHGGMTGDLLPTDLDPGQQAALLFGTADACTALNQPDQQAMAANAAANTYPGLVIALPEGSGSVTVIGLGIDTACGLSESQLGVALPTVPSEPPDAVTPRIAALPTFSPIPGSLGSLLVQLRLSRPIRNGSVFHYQVVLSNPDAVAVSFSKCPTYTESYGALSSKFMQTARSYVLNCRTAKSLRAHGSATFAMAIKIPRGFTTGSVVLATFGWRLNVEGGPYPFASKVFRATLPAP
jgi:hypothetical protein